MPSGIEMLAQQRVSIMEQQTQYDRERGMLGGLGALGGFSGLSLGVGRRSAQETAYSWSVGTAGTGSDKSKTFREELQKETDVWLD